MNLSSKLNRIDKDLDQLEKKVRIKERCIPLISIDGKLKIRLGGCEPPILGGLTIRNDEMYSGVE